MKKKITIAAIVLLIVAVAVIIGFSRSSSSNEKSFTLQKVQKGNVTDKAMAIGQIEPEREIVVKSQISGIVSKIYADVGDRVSSGDPLFSIAPRPTPIEYAEAKRQVELQEVSYDIAKREFDRVEGLFAKSLVSEKDIDAARNDLERADVMLQSAKEKLQLIDEGKTNIAGRAVENIIRSPISGTVLQRHVEEGDPVVPLTSYQSGTEMMSLAEMENLIFKGTVDEIDVGKLTQGMDVRLQIGAIPNDTVEGLLSRISPKARKQDNTTVFDVEIHIKSAPKSNVLRAGYSANAEIVVAEKRDVLVLPERLVAFVNDSAFVEIKDSTGALIKQPVEIGLSDGINIEIVSGLADGQEVVEQPPKTIK
jgi:HlyD family secretion protein